jgi:hypothetical protein
MGEAAGVEQLIDSRGRVVGVQKVLLEEEEAEVSSKAGEAELAQGGGGERCNKRGS